MGRTLWWTGRLGVGKTTVIRKVTQELGDEAGAFYTDEIRGPDGRRRGFRLVTLQGKTAVMAHVELRHPDAPQVSRYGVDLDAIEKVGIGALKRAMVDDALVVVDEIKKMELFSQAFRDVVSAAVDGSPTVLGTVMRGNHPFVEALKPRRHVGVWEVTTDNRDRLPEGINRWLMR
jgi:nucleoside-triphosphatase